MNILKEGAWQRIEAVIALSGMSVGGFANYIGISRAESLYQIKRGKTGISRKMAERITEAFTQINFAWLYSGVGEMMNCNAAAQGFNSIPFYDAEAEADIRRIDELQSPTSLTMPKEVVADLMMYYKGGAMGGKVPPNSIVALKKVTPAMIVPGYEYLIQTKNFCVLRTVRIYSAKTGDNLLKLTPERSDCFDNLIIERGDIEAVYRLVSQTVINY